MGRIAAPHGVRGSIKVRPLSGNPASLLEFPQWWLRAREADAWVPYRVSASRLQSGVLVAELDGIATREAAGALRSAVVGVPRALLPALEEHEYYRADLAGFTVVNRDGQELGAVIDFVESGAHPIVRVGGSGGAERLIPWVAQYIDSVDGPARRIEVDWPADY
jgi:16S rRNA processing protein RimM